MPAYARQLDLRRLIAVAMSLVLVLASVAGMSLHASAQGHHEHMSAGLIQADLDAQQEHEPVDHAHQHHDKSVPCSHDSSHSMCGDLICHGGWTVIDNSAVSVALTAVPVHFSWHNEVIANEGRIGLDRPPKSLVHA